MEITAAELWTQVLDASRQGMPEQSFRTWLAGSEAVSLTDRELVVSVPSQFHMEWIEDKYAPVLSRLLERMVGHPMRLTFQTRQTPGESEIPTVEVRAESATSAAPADSTSPVPRPTAGMGLNDRYTFDRYVVGTGNQLAAAACRAVAERPARTYNPLFLYGGVGLGKTHLMHAIGNEVLSHTPSALVAYVPSEQFTNELVTSIQQGKMAEFRHRYRRIDVLLVDDVHFLEGKERTQEEFFHTFNALYDARKQIVLTSDRPPKEIPGLEARLISRFEWGLVADVKVPDFETRMAILRKKADDDALALDEGVIEYIARHCTASVRELEGAIIKLLAFSSLTNQEITIDLAQSALRGVLGDRENVRRSLSPEKIAQAVAKEWGVSVDALASKRRTRDITVPRQVAMYLIKEMLHTPLVQIGELFGGRDHSTVIHSVRKVEEQLRGDPNLQARVEGVRIRVSRVV